MENEKILKPNLEAILNDVNYFINIKSKRQSYATHFQELKNQIFAILRKNEPFGYIFNGFQLGGSYGDNLKVAMPDEFDLVFHFRFPDNHLLIVEEDKTFPGNVRINLSKVLDKIRNEKQHAARINIFRSWADENNYLSVKQLQSYFESCLHKTLQRMNYKIIVNGAEAKLRYTKEGPAHTIHVDDECGMTYSVDFVPGLHLDESQSITDGHVGRWEAIPKPMPKIGNHHTSFRASYYRQEQILIDGKKNLKNALRIMKKFRDVHLNMNKMKSYFIKTLFLWKAKENPGEQYWHSPLTVIIVDMFRAMENSLEIGKLNFFWDSRLNLYKDFGRNLILQMLTNVRSARKNLEAASSSLSLPLQTKIYAIFLNKKEREMLEKAVTRTTISEAISPSHFNTEENQPQPRTKEKSWCVIA